MFNSLKHGAERAHRRYPFNSPRSAERIASHPDWEYEEERRPLERPFMDRDSLPDASVIGNPQYRAQCPTLRIREQAQKRKSD